MNVLERSTRQLQEQLGARIRSLRTKKGWSQEELAARCGLHRSHMGEIERGQSNVTMSTLISIVQTLEVSVSTLFKDIG
jgi:transcriptional regulator with XRE-family HTH domain